MTDTLPPIRVSYSQLTTLRDCPLKFRLHYLEGWRQTDEPPNQNLLLGTVWHLMLEAHYREIYRLQHNFPYGRSPVRGGAGEAQWLGHCKEEALHAMYTAEEWELLSDESREALPWMLDGYHEMYGLDPAWRILDVEYSGLAPLGIISTPDGLREVVLDYRVDLIVEDSDRGGVFAVEHKSAGQLSSRFDLELDDQTLLYEWAFRRSAHPLATKINGCVRSESKKTMNAGDKPGAGPRSKAQTLEQRFKRQSIPRSGRELAAGAADALATAQAGYGGMLPVYSSPNPKECVWKCQFSEVHIMARRGDNLSTLMRDFGFEKKK